MEHPIIFSKKEPAEIMRQNKSGILNFQNLYSIYLLNRKLDFRKAISCPNNFIFTDGKILSLLLKTTQIRGPTFTRIFFQKNLNKKQKHFFILSKEEDLERLVEKFPKLKNPKAYSPPHIKGINFSKKEIAKIEKEIKLFKPDYIWVCIGNPKQEILANRLYKKYPAWYFNIGAAMDFLLNKKKESPIFFQKIGLEWFYRLITDFRHSKKKVLGSIYGLLYIHKLK